MKTAEELKSIVKEKYAEIADQSKEQNAVSCCGAGECATVDYSIFAEDYSQKDGYLDTADLMLGCGIPVDHANIKKGDTVVDLGSGAGNDVFVARALVGPEGSVIGLDMTERMIELANTNKDKLGFKNVQFRLGDIENMPIAADKADVVISNCVLNLVPNKQQAFAEVYRILKPEGHFCISDVVIRGNLPEAIVNAAEMYAGCVSGAVPKHEYMGIIHDTGFEAVSIKSEKEIQVPDEILSNYLNPEELETFKKSNAGIFSVTVYASKGKKEECTPGGGCC